MSRKKPEEKRYVTMESDGVPVVSYTLSELTAIYDNAKKEPERVDYKNKDTGQYDFGTRAGEPFRMADLAGIPWILDPPDTASGQWARNACRAAGFEPDVRYAGPDLLFEIRMAETGHAAAVIPGLLLSAVPRPRARIQRIPGHPHRRLTTGVRAGAARHPAIRAFREALRQAVGEASRGEARTSDSQTQEPD